ncbi:MAG: hypothetical protein GX633_06245, partial [Clostridiales bacterium]|nr:hypothetical protein [Clostridiales bacterium]
MHKRIQAFFLAVLIIISLPCTFAYDSSHTLIPGLDYSESFISSDNGGVQLHTFTYKSSGNVSPKIVYGSKLYGRSTLDELRTYMDSSGISPIG